MGAWGAHGATVGSWRHVGIVLKSLSGLESDASPLPPRPMLAGVAAKPKSPVNFGSGRGAGAQG